MTNFRIHDISLQKISFNFDVVCKKNCTRQTDFPKFDSHPVLTLFVIPGKMTADMRIKRISVPRFPDGGYPFHPHIRCHFSEPQNPLEPDIFGAC